MIDVLLQARERGLYSRITDCGGGGLSSAVGEMAADTGARVYLDRVPLKYSGLTYTEIWISESQERMVLAVAQDKVDAILKLFAGEDVEELLGRPARARSVSLRPHSRVPLDPRSRPICRKVRQGGVRGWACALLWIKSERAPWDGGATDRRAAGTTKRAGRRNGFSSGASL